MVLNSIGSAGLQELWSDNAFVGHQLKSGGGSFEKLMLYVVQLIAARCCGTEDCND